MTVVVEQPIANVEEGVRKKRWTREEVSFLESTALFEGQHWELVDGDLINKMGKKRRHTASLLTAVTVLRKVFGTLAVEQEANIDIRQEDNRTSEPEPDIVVTTRDVYAFAANPQPDDIRLLVEVSDPTLRHDRTVKARLYARAGIAEYWVMDVVNRHLFVHRSPAGDTYQNVVQYTEDESVSTLAAPDHAILISGLFGPALPPDAE